MSRGGVEIARREREGRWAIAQWCYYQSHSKWRSLPTEWLIQVRTPRQPLYAYSTAKNGPTRNRKVHRVRDQLVATHISGGGAIIQVRYLCGSDSYYAELTPTAPPKVCRQCENRYHHDSPTIQPEEKV